MQLCTLHNGCKILFVESICDNPEIVESNIKEAKISSPDYQAMDQEKAVKDFLERINHYERAYESLDDELDKGLSYIKIINQGEKFVVNRVNGHVQSRVVYYLMNIHVLPRTIYLCRHGESTMNLKVIVVYDL